MKYLICLLLVVSVGCSQSTKQKKNSSETASFDPTVIGDDAFTDILDEEGVESDADFGSNDFDSDNFSGNDFGDETASFDDFTDEAPSIESDNFNSNDFGDDSFSAPVVSQPAPVYEAPQVYAEAPQVYAEAPAASASKINNIEYFADGQGGSVVVSTNGSASYTSRFDPSTRQLVLEVDNALLPSSLKRPFVMKDFSGAAFGALNAYQGSGSSVARIVVQVKSDSEPSVLQEGNSIVIKPGSFGSVSSFASSSNVNEPVFAETYNEPVQSGIGASGQALGARTMEEFLMTNQKFYGHPISVEFREADIKEVIDFLSEESGTNIVLSGDVEGKISVKLRSVPWDQALVIVMRSQELGYIRQGNVIRIAKTDSLQAEQDKALAIIERKLQSAPLQVQMIPVNYAEVGELVTQVTPFLTEKRGKIVSDARTSSLIVTDTSESIQKVLQIVKELDVPPSQVLIEGKIIEATQDFQSSFGINWAASGDQIGLGSGTLTPSLRVGPGDIPGAGLLNLQAGVFDFIGNLSAQIGVAEQNNVARVLSSPRITALNKESAKIEQSTQVPFTTTVNNDGITEEQVSFQEFSLSMDVTPQITADESIIMDINVNRSFPREGSSAGNAQSSQDSSADTKVIVKNGETAVVGGIYQGLTSNNTSGIPGISKIPVLGWLFKSKSKSNNKSELLIFLTPRILNQQNIPNKL